jgi:D-alanyl-D-alanine carboxypeptidase
MITRRSFIALGGGLAASLFAAGHSPPQPALYTRDTAGLKSLLEVAPESDEQMISSTYTAPITNHHPESYIVDQIAPVAATTAPEPPPDIIANAAQRHTIGLVSTRLRRLQAYVGHGNFNIIGWDQSLKIAASRLQIGAFTRSELELIEELFSTDAQTLGFYGDKVVNRLSASIPKKKVIKIPGTGHFLFKGPATETYVKIRKDLGDSVLLTSGIRSVVKQIYLFLNKVEKVDGNLSLASYSLAPPGHSYHAVGDFDVGKKGFGLKNFSAEFAQTDEFKRLIDMGYLDIRYTEQNPFGVRYEPWHIKIV